MYSVRGHIESRENHDFNQKYMPRNIGRNTSWKIYKCEGISALNSHRGHICSGRFSFPKSYFAKLQLGNMRRNMGRNTGRNISIYEGI